MKVQHHVNIIGYSMWVRGRDVVVRDAQLYCPLALDRPYDLPKSYERSPHLQYLTWKTDQELVRFAETWGPLYLSRQEQDRGVSIRPTAEYRAFQTWLRTLLKLLEGYRRSEHVRERFLEFLAADAQWPTTQPSTPHLSLKLTFCPNGDVTQWLEKCTIQKLREAVKVKLDGTPLVEFGILRVAQNTRSPNIEAGWLLHTLRDALMWMIWQDEVNRNPLLFCHECGTLFRPETAHARKYCSPECGHRVAARNWRRRQLARKNKINLR